MPIFGHFSHFFSFLGLVGGFLELKGPKLVPMIIIYTNERRGDVYRSRFQRKGFITPPLLVDTSNNFISFDLDGIRPDDLRKDHKRKVDSFLEKRYQSKRKNQ